HQGGGSRIAYLVEAGLPREAGKGCRRGRSLVLGRRRQAEERGLDEISIEQHLPSQRLLILDRFRQNDSTIGNDREHVGKVIEVDACAWRIALCNQIQTSAEPLSPIQHRR